MPNQSPIINGVEVDKYYRPVAYYLTEGTAICYEAGKREKIPASDIIHIFKHEFPKQTRGIPPFNAVLNDLNQLAAYRKAEVSAAQVGACTGIAYERNTMTTTGDFIDESTDDNGEFTQRLYPGMATVVPMGYNVKSITPNHPNDNFDEFNKAVLKQIASSLGVSYAKLIKDYAGVNYSSLREGSLDEQAYFQEQQSFLIESWKEIEFKLFLESIALHTDIIKPSQIKDIMRYHTWAAVKRAYFDKGKDILAEERSIALGIKSPIDVIYEQGGDPEEVLKNFALWDKICQKNGQSFKTNVESHLPEPAPDDDSDK